MSKSRSNYGSISGMGDDATDRRASRDVWTEQGFASEPEDRHLVSSSNSDLLANATETSCGQINGICFFRWNNSPWVNYFITNGKKLLVKYWIWLIAITLMAMSISGDKVVVFRIFYMFLFLGFLLTFQLSYNLWRRLLLPFLITVMIYSTLVLVAVYTYQFRAIQPLWKEYLHVDEKWQRDLGLKKYEYTLELFYELLKPTIFILITLIHLTSFHKEFMDLTRLDDPFNPSSSQNVSCATRRTTLPTLLEEPEHMVPASASTSFIDSSNFGHRKILRSESHRSVSIDSSIGAAGGKVPETLIEMREKHDILANVFIDGPSNNRMSPPVSPSARSISFSMSDQRPPGKSGPNLRRSSSRRSTLSGDSVGTSPSKSHRRKTIVDMTQGKPLANNLKTAATDIRDRATNLWDSAKPGINELYELMWRIAELHMMKIIYLIIFAISIAEITAVNFIFAAASAIALPLARYESVVSITFGIWSAILILTKMLYQLSIADYFKHTENCTLVHFAPTRQINNETVLEMDYPPFNNVSLMDYRNYLGYQERNYIFPYIGKYLLILLILTINSVITLRQRIHRLRYGVVDNPASLLFLQITRRDADRDFLNLAKFLLNFGFYKFGLEVTILSMILLIGNRMDVMSLIYSICVMLCSLLKRKTVSKFWPFLTLTVMISIPLQYIMSLGIPPILCIEYPWYRLIDPELRSWLYLPDFRYPPEGSLIFYDFVVLLFASRQWIVFQVESIPNYVGGSNMESYYYTTMEAKFGGPTPSTLNKKDAGKNDLPDFFTFQKSLLDRIKSWFFSSFYWITLGVVFYAANGRTNLFGLGYILGCFFFLWNGSEFYLKPISNIVKTWKFMIAYCASVIALKTVLHVVGCVESDILFDQFCWVAKLLGISCTCKLKRDGASISNERVGTSCAYTDTTSGLLLDGVCFLFLLIQKRIFGSYYFTYLVKDIKAQQVLASRGAELIHEIQAKEVMEQEEAEKDVMEKIKMKMDRIRAYQQSIKIGDKSRLPPERKSHRQEVSDYGGISPYSTADDGSLAAHSPAPGFDDGSSLPHTLPTVYSPTPSLPTILSPSSAASAADGKGYLEVYRLPNIKHIDDPCSSPPTMPSMSFASSPILEDESSMVHHFNFASTTVNPPSDAVIHPSQAILSRPSFKLHQKPVVPLTRLHSITRKQSTHSTAASHGSVRSGDYYLFDDPETEDAEIDFEEKPRKSLIPDPEGDELRRIANLRGISAFMNQLLKGELEPEQIEPPMGPDEYDLDIGESSKDSAIISVDREKETLPDPDESQATMVTTVVMDEPKASTSTTGDSKDSEGKSSSKKGPKRKISQVSDKEKAADDGQEEDTGQPGQQPPPQQMQISIWLKLIHWFTVFYWFIESCVISATAKLNNVSRDYRYVSRRLEVEKRALKMLFEMEESVGVTYDHDWKRSTLEKISRATVPRNSSLDSVKKFSREAMLRQQQQKAKHQLEMEKAQGNVVTEEGDKGDDQSDESSTLVSSNAFIRLFRSLWYTTVSQSEMVCYATIIFNQMINASPLSLPLPIMVFLWGCMSVPRPSKTFWISLITYTEAVVVAKYIFNFAVWPTMDYSTWQPKVVKSGELNNSVTATPADLFLLLVLFFHRVMLKSLGLWDLDDSADREAKGALNSVDKSLNDESGSTVVAATINQPPKQSYAVRPPVARRRKLNKELSAVELANDQQQITSAEATDAIEGSYKTATPGDQSSCTGSSNSYDGNKNHPQAIGKNKFISLISISGKKVSIALKPIHNFYYRLLHPPFRIRHDLYSFMFLCDFINFFIVVMAFNSFGSSTGESITKYFEDNKVPIPFLFMIMAQFCSMIIDRSLYLRKNIKLRLYFHIALVFIIHFWLFFSLPSYTERPFQDLGPPKVWYIFKCIYLILSAIQVKGGYPTRILGNTFTKKYSYFNLYLFKGYMLVPFLYDMRLIMDWIWTDTSLELDEWSIMEDIFKNLFQRKCELQFQANFPMFRGFPRQMYTKYLLGGAYLVMIIGAIWFPLVLFAVGGRVGTPNRPIDVVVEMEISGYVPLAKLTATKVNETYLEDGQFERLKLVYKNKKEATTFLDSYYRDDTTMVKLNGNSTPVWGISPPSKQALINDLKEHNFSMDFRISWKISRHKTSKGQVMDLEVAKTYYTHLTDETRDHLVEVLAANDTTNYTKPVVIPRIFPNFLRVPEKSEPEVIPQLNRDAGDEGYRNISLELKRDGTIMWFEVHDICTPSNDPYIKFYDHRCDFILLMLINERVFPGALQVVSGYGILGLYTTFVFVVSRLIRSLFDDVSFKVIYTQMPNVDKVLQLCLDIYLVRESREFTLEEDLYAKLLFLYRSPETLIKWTKQIEEDQFEKTDTMMPIRDQ